MEHHERYIEGVPAWVDSNHADVAAAMEFYGGLFGWEFHDAGTDGRPYQVARLDGGDVAAIAGLSEGDQNQATWNTYIWVDDADRSAKAVLDNGGRVLAEPFDVGKDGRMAVVTDLEGAAFRLWQAREHRGAQVVNQHGSVVFNDLQVRDIDRAKTFYRGVFDWTTFGFDGSDDFWALPAYADHLEALNPGFKAGFAEAGMAGFVEVVGSLNQIPDGDSETPAHWAVTFGVDDTDSAAERAVELGGSLVVEPFDAPPVRATVIADPQGVTFTASQYKPES